MELEIHELESIAKHLSARPSDRGLAERFSKLFSTIVNISLQLQVSAKRRNQLLERLCGVFQKAYTACPILVYEDCVEGYCMTLKASKKKKKAVRFLTNALEKTRHPKLLANLAALLCDLKDYGNALPIAREAVSLCDEDRSSFSQVLPVALHNYAVTLEGNRDYTRAIKVYTEAVRAAQLYAPSLVEQFSHTAAVAVDAQRIRRSRMLSGGNNRRHAHPTKILSLKPLLSTDSSTADPREEIDNQKRTKLHVHRDRKVRRAPLMHDNISTAQVLDSVTQKHGRHSPHVNCAFLSHPSSPNKSEELQNRPGLRQTLSSPGSSPGSGFQPEKLLLQEEQEEEEQLAAEVGGLSIPWNGSDSPKQHLSGCLSQLQTHVENVSHSLFALRMDHRATRRELWKPMLP